MFLLPVPVLSAGSLSVALFGLLFLVQDGGGSGSCLSLLLEKRLHLLLLLNPHQLPLLLHLYLLVGVPPATGACIFNHPPVIVHVWLKLSVITTQEFELARKICIVDDSHQLVKTTCESCQQLVNLVGFFLLLQKILHRPISIVLLLFDLRKPAVEHPSSSYQHRCD
jgi:hypothetical protein